MLKRVRFYVRDNYRKTLLKIASKSFEKSKAIEAIEVLYQSTIF